MLNNMSKAIGYLNIVFGVIAFVLAFVFGVIADAPHHGLAVLAHYLFPLFLGGNALLLFLSGVGLLIKKWWCAPLGLLSGVVGLILWTALAIAVEPLLLAAVAWFSTGATLLFFRVRISRREWIAEKQSSAN